MVGDISRIIVTEVHVRDHTVSHVSISRGVMPGLDKAIADCEMTI
jgi:hypothetical protein